MGSRISKMIATGPPAGGREREAAAAPQARPCWREIRVVRTHDPLALTGGRRLPSWAGGPWQRVRLVRTHDAGFAPAGRSRRPDLAATPVRAYARPRVSAGATRAAGPSRDFSPLNLRQRKSRTLSRAQPPGFRGLAPAPQVPDGQPHPTVERSRVEKVPRLQPETGPSPAIKP